MATSSIAVGATIAAVGAAVTAIAVRRRGIRRALRERDRAWRNAHPVGADGVVDGAASIALDAPGPRAVLLLHGFGDTPQSMLHLALALHAGGWTVRAPLLPGHGRTLADFGQTDAEGEGENSRGDTEGDDVGEGVHFTAKVGFGAGEAGSEIVRITVNNDEAARAARWVAVPAL